MRKYVADFETVNSKDDCRVWAWALTEIEGDCSSVEFGNDMETFLERMSYFKGERVYFHNLKFDGKFIIDYILKEGWQWVPVESEASICTFTTLISDMNQFYTIHLHFDETHDVEFCDSLKVVSLPVAKIPAAFGLEVQKLDLDYNAPREVGHVLTDQEKEYIAHDVIVVAQAMKIMLDAGNDRITAGSNALASYKKSIGGTKRYRRRFPGLRLRR